MHGRRSCAHDQGPARASRRVCLGRPGVTGLLGCSIAIEILVSRYDLAVRCRDIVLVSRQGLACGRCRNKYAQQKIFVATGFAMFSITTEKSLS